MSNESIPLVEVGAGSASCESSFDAGSRAARQAAAAIRHHGTSLALVYASMRYDLERALAGVQAALGDTPVIGVTTAGELKDEMRGQSIAVVALASPFLRVAAAAGSDVSGNWTAALDEAMGAPQVRAMLADTPEAVQERTRRGARRFAMLFTPGNTRSAASLAYEALEAFKARTLGQIPVFAGASADDWRLESNAVMLGGRVYPNGLLLAVFETELRFGLALGHGFQPTGEPMRISAAEGREVIALDGRGAAEVLAERLGMTQQEISTVHVTLATGKTLGAPSPMGQYSVNVATFATPRGGVRLTQPVTVGATLTVMEAAPDAMAGAEVLRKALLRAGTSRPAAVLCHYCALRPRIMGEERARSEIAEMRRLVPDALFAGFSSFGEGALSDDGVSRQNNAAIAVFVLGAELSDAAQAAREIERLRDELISQAELRLLGGALAQTEEAFLVGDGRMRITYANPAFVRLFGYPAEELIGNEVRMLVPQDEDAAGFPDAIARQVRSQGHFRGEVRRRAKDGRVIPVLLNVAPLRDASERMIGWIAAFTDISERKAAEDKLRESETRFRETFDNAPIGMGVSSIDGGRLIDANRSFCDFVGYSIEELRTLSLQDISHPEDMHLSYEGMRRLVEGGARTYVVEKRYRRKDGRDAWGQATATLVRGADGSPRYLIVVIEDIQRRKQAEAALIDAKERLGMALEASELSTWDFDIAAGTVRLDERWAAMMGLAPGATPWRIEALADMIHPEDRQEAGVAMVAALKGVAPGYQCETRMRSGDGAWRWIRCTGKVVERDAGGRALRAIGTFLDVTDRRAVEEQVRAMAFFDTLTGLPNRVLFLDRLRLAIAAARRDSKPLAVMYVDLDRFKEINDTRGHAVGDEVLREVAQRFQRVMRESDTLARLGGDEFGVVACGADKSEAAFLANRLTASLETKVQVGSESHSVGLSVGIAHYPFDGATPDLLMRNADIAMYRAKVSRGGIANYDFAMSSRLLERIALAADLKDAIDRPGGQLSLFYQPQIELRSGCAIGAEALLRWHHPKRGSIDAGTFLPLAEERGMMPVLGAWVLREACAQLRAWREAGLALPGRLAINVSAQEIEDADFERAILSAVEESGLAPTQIELELTETGMMENVDRAVEIFGRLSVRGFSLAIDDFGTGYSSLAYLKRLPVSRLKIDRSFVRDMTMDANDHAIVATVVAMGRTLGLQTVAEGVETREQADALLALGCEAAQGYLFGRPVPAGELAQNWLAQFRPESLAAR